MKSRNGDWFLTYTGRQFWPLDPRPEDICIRDIAHHLALTCRFNGACRVFYSVAQHCCIVSDALPPHLRPQGLLHDATEAYCGDMIRPLKRFMPQYRDVEFGIWLAICQRYQLVPLENDLPLDPLVKEMDNRALMTERRDLLDPSPHEWCINESQFPPFPHRVEAWAPVKAEAEFLMRFFELFP